MDTDFWHQRWERNEIAFHNNEVHPLLANYFTKLSLNKEKRIFVPLCGKTLDIDWFLSHNYHVVGSELSEIAIEQLFRRIDIQPVITEKNNLKHYNSDKLDVFVGNIFDISKNILGNIDAIYDRAALVALPEEMRYEYTNHLKDITEKAKQLLITFEYDQSVMNGPPFSISKDELNKHYQKDYKLTLLESFTIEGGLKGKCPAKENIWLLEN